MGSFDSLRYRDYRLFWGGALLSNVGTWMQSTALSWYVFVLTRSAFWVSFVTFMNFFPMVLAPIGGVLTDRVDRRRILLVTQGTMMVLAAVLAVLTVQGRAQLGVVLAITLGQGLAFAINGPTWLAFVPSLVPPETMVNAIALNSTQFNGARVVGPALGGALLAAAGAEWVFGVNAVSYLTVLLALVLIRTRWEPPSVTSGVAASMAGGFSYMWRHHRIRALLATTAVLSFFVAPVQALLPLFAGDVFERGPGGYGLLGTALGVGSVAGALALGRLGTRVTLRTIAVSCMVVGSMVGLFSAVPWYGAGLVLIGLYGGAYLFTIAAINSAIQLELEEEMRGRVMSLFMLAWVPFPIGAVVAGAVAERIGAPSTTATGAVVCALWGAVMVWRLFRGPAGRPALEPG